MQTRLSDIVVDPLDEQLAASLRGDHEEAWRLAQLLEKARPDDNRAAFNRGWHYMHRGDLLKGFELTERGRLEGVYGSPAIKTTKPRWSRFFISTEFVSLNFVCGPVALMTRSPVSVSPLLKCTRTCFPSAATRAIPAA